MELRHLRYFVAVAQELSFRRAAAKLGVAQPALSQQIRALEVELGTQLLLRTRRSVELTGPGVAFLVEAELTVRQADRARRVGERAGRGEVGSLDLGYVASAAYSSVLSSCVFTFRRAFPDVEVRLAMQDTALQMEALANDVLDLGFVRLPLPRCVDGVRVMTIVREPLIVALRHDHPLAAAEIIPIAALRDEPLVGMQPPQAGPGYWSVINDICRKHGFTPRLVEGLTPNDPQKAHQLATVVGLVGAGLGIAIVPATMRAFRPSAVVYRELSGVTERAELAVAYRPATRSQVTTAFIEHVRRWMDQPPGEGLVPDKPPRSLAR